MILIDMDPEGVQVRDMNTCISDTGICMNALVQLDFLLLCIWCRVLLFALAHMEVPTLG